MISINKLKFSYGKSHFDLVIDKLNFPKGSITAVVGGNGSGKTTLFRLLSGVFTPKTPCLSINQEAPTFYKNLGCKIVMHNAYAGLDDKLTIRQLAKTTAKLYKSPSDDKTIEHHAQSIGCYDYLDRLPSTLSAGQKQRGMLLKTLVTEPDVILLDEPTTALDVVGIENTLDWIKSLNKMGITIIVSTHHLYEIAMMKPNVVGLHHGRVLLNEQNADLFSTPEATKALIKSVVEGTL